MAADYADENALKEHIEKVVEFPGKPAPRKTIKASAYVWRDPATIPPREILYGRHYVRKFLSGTVSPGGVGKSSQALVEAVAMATGRDLLGVPLKDRLRVWYWCGEDPMDELERRVAGVLLHYQIPPAEIEGRLFLNSGRDCEIVIATESRDGSLIAQPVLDELEATLKDNEIDIFMLDPFVSAHAVSENDNGKINSIVKALRNLCEAVNGAGELIHHTRKANGSSEVTAEDTRGAKSFVDGVRSLRTLNRMSDDEAARFGVDEEERLRLFRVDIGKGNLFPPSARAVWRKLETVGLGNAMDGRPEDHVGVVTSWKAPGVFDGVTPHDVLRVQQAIFKGSYRESVQANDWVGKIVAQTLDLDVQEAKARVKEMLRTWMKSGLLRVEKKQDGTRQMRPVVMVGKWIEP